MWRTTAVCVTSGDYEFVFTPHLANAQVVRTSRPPRLVRRRHVPADGDGQRHVPHEADELSDALPDLQESAAQLSRVALRLFELGNVYHFTTRQHLTV
ncbi:MAG: hypothetical protein R2697_05230 [Ilumatobacteraceae bacterium]